jgi:hypothetical protein
LDRASWLFEECKEHEVFSQTAILALSIVSFWSRVRVDAIEEGFDGRDVPSDGFITVAKYATDRTVTSVLGLEHSPRDIS